MVSLQLVLTGLTALVSLNCGAVSPNKALRNMYRYFQLQGSEDVFYV